MKTFWKKSVLFVVFLPKSKLKCHLFVVLNRKMFLAFFFW